MEHNRELDLLSGRVDQVLQSFDPLLGIVHLRRPAGEIFLIVTCSATECGQLLPFGNNSDESSSASKAQSAGQIQCTQLVKSDANGWSNKMQMGGQVDAITHIPETSLYMGCPHCVRRYRLHFFSLST
jgi:hypothetical protein